MLDNIIAAIGLVFTFQSLAFACFGVIVGFVFGALPGIGGKELSSDQKDQLAASLRAVMQPYRKEDVDEVMEILESGGGLDSLHLSFYRTGDLDEDQVWDIWRLESPTVVCHFRGAPHVHAYINIAKRA